MGDLVVNAATNPCLRLTLTNLGPSAGPHHFRRMVKDRRLESENTVAMPSPVLLLALLAAPEPKLDATQAKADLRQLAQLLEDSHPDGHTTIRNLDAKDDRRSWIEPVVLGGGIYVAAVYAEPQRAYLGWKITEVEGVSTQALLERMGMFRGYDNLYGNLTHLAQAIVRPQEFEDLLDRDRLKALRIKVSGPQGQATALEVKVGPTAPGPRIGPKSRVTAPPLDAAQLGFGFVTPDRSVAMLRIASMSAYREAFEIWRSTGYQKNLGAPLSEVAKAASGRAPEGVDARIALVPSASERMADATARMREAKTRTLIVDLRDNEGGSSAISLIVGWYLFPMKRLLAQDEGYQIPRYSALYFANYVGRTPEAIRAEGWTDFQTGDLDFKEELSWNQRAPNPELRLRQLERYVPMMPTFQKAYGAPLTRWEGEVIVLTSARTYSAAYDLLVVLKRLGAKVVGVPSAQAGNCFIDSLAYRLDHSGLEGSISFKRSLKFPDDPNMGALLLPDLELDYANWSALGFDPEAAVLLALEPR